MDASFFVGLVVLAACAIFITIAAARHPALLGVLIAAFALRIGLVWIDNIGIFDVPGSGADGVRFYRAALTYSEMTWIQLAAEIDISRSYVYSILVGALIKAFGPGTFLPIAVNVALGVIGVFVIHRLAFRLWDSQAATWASWVAAMYPFAAFNSAAILREEISILCFLLGLYATVRWVHLRSPLLLAGAIFGFSAATVFHGGWFVALVGLLVVVLRETLSGVVGAAKVSSWISQLASVAVVSLFAAFVATTQLTLSSYVGDPVEQLAGGAIESLEERFVRESTGGSAYPLWITQGEPLQQPWLIPGRLFYFLFSPMPWDIRELRHALGFVGTITYGWLAFRIWRNRHTLMRRRDHQAAFLICFLVIFVFAIGTTNIGTSLRHRTKVFGVLVALAAGTVARSLRRRTSALRSR